MFRALVYFGLFDVVSWIFPVSDQFRFVQYFFAWTEFFLFFWSFHTVKLLRFQVAVVDNMPPAVVGRKGGLVLCDSFSSMAEHISSIEGILLFGTGFFHHYLWNIQHCEPFVIVEKDGFALNRLAAFFFKVEWNPEILQPITASNKYQKSPEVYFWQKSNYRCC